MVLHNLDPHHGLCKGKRVCLIDMKSRLLEVRIISGPKAGETALIPHINFVPNCLSRCNIGNSLSEWHLP